MKRKSNLVAKFAAAKNKQNKIKYNGQNEACIFHHLMCESNDRKYKFRYTKPCH